MNTNPLDGATEHYRLRRAVVGESGCQRMEPVPDHPALFHTWRDAMAAARIAGGRRASIVIQSVLVDAAGVVVFPTDANPQRSRGMWRSRAWASRAIHPQRAGKPAKPSAPVTKKGAFGSQG